MWRVLIEPFFSELNDDLPLLHQIFPVVRQWLHLFIPQGFNSFDIIFTATAEFDRVSFSLQQALLYDHMA
jgi:hypothetical protein